MPSTSANLPPRENPPRENPPRESLIEVRVLDGPSPDMVPPAVRLTLQLPESLGLDDAEALLRDIANVAEISVDPVARRTLANGHVVLAYPWTARERATSLGQHTASAIDDIGAGVPRDTAVQRAAQEVRLADPGDSPQVIDPYIPSIAVTGTNGKTTTTRLIAHIARCAGRSVAWSSTDGVFVDGRCVDRGDWSGPGGARQVLAQNVDIAVLETARGGLMQRGMGVGRVDATVVTNISDDHLGLHGIDTLEDLAWAKSTPTKIVDPDGWVILNADDPLVLAMAPESSGRLWLTSLDAAHVDGLVSGAPARRFQRLTTIRDGRMVMSEGSDDIDLGAVADMPITLAGLSPENVANALGAASGALALGVPVDAIREGLATFTPDTELNPGRLNVFSVDNLTVVIDYAHNDAGADALFRVARGLVPPGGRLVLSIGNAGDRTDENIRYVARRAAEEGDLVALTAKPKYLRGRTQEAIDDLQREGLRQGGKTEWLEHPNEVAGLTNLIQTGQPGDVVAIMIHEDRSVIFSLLDRLGATLDDPSTIQRKARAARA